MGVIDDTATGAAAGSVVPGIGTAIGAGVGLITGLISNAVNNSNTDSTNRANQAFALSQQDKQNAFNVSMWNMQNQYNSPQAAMARFKAAGLNPNLIYGAGASGATFASAPTPSAKADFVAVTHKPVDYGSDISRGITASNDIRLANAQSDNLAAQAKNTALESFLRAGTMDSNIQLAAHSAEAKGAEVAKLNADTKVELAANERANALQQPTMAKALQEVINLRSANRLTTSEQARVMQETQNLIQTNRLNDINLQFKSHGLDPNENSVTRLLGVFIDAIARKAGVDGILLPYSK